MSKEFEDFVARGIAAQQAIDDLIPVISVDRIINPEADDPTPRRWAVLQWGGALDTAATDPTHISSPGALANFELPVRFVRAVACETGRRPVYGPWVCLDEDLLLPGNREVGQ